MEPTLPGPLQPAPAPSSSANVGARRAGQQRRRGRERGLGGPGASLLPRLGPSSPAFAAFHNPLELAGSQNGAAALAAALELEHTPLEQLTFVALDCETTGHFPHRIVELGAVRFHLVEEGREGSPRVSLESLVHTVDHINPFARRVHGIHRSMLSGAPTLAQVTTAFDALSQGAVLVEHSADAFDTRLVSRALGRPLPKLHLDTSRIAGFLFQLRDTIGLERLCERLGVGHRSPHFALADAEATADCFVALARLGQGEFGWRTLGDLAAVGMPPPPRLEPRPPRRGTGAEHRQESPEKPTRRRRRGSRGRRSGAPAPSPLADDQAAPG
ncbi:MAG: 3'-5' exonuclease [Candidatus Dormibacteria bacterium]